jgi:hypothetical protein
VLSHVGGPRASEPDIHAPMAAAWQVVAITMSSISSMPKPIALATNTPVIRAREDLGTTDERAAGFGAA